uniref:syntaxin-binding protein 4 isoform X2 n=1 Tax=Podarcis muralis TaxID=64176 RepID=UPI00109F86C8|nr:syntaxin-binding protein 4 isoform X2 [Podarcis muralis]
MPATPTTPAARYVSTVLLRCLQSSCCRRRAPAKGSPPPPLARRPQQAAASPLPWRRSQARQGPHPRAAGAARQAQPRAQPPMPFLFRCPAPSCHVDALGIPPFADTTAAATSLRAREVGRLSRELGPQGGEPTAGRRARDTVAWNAASSSSACGNRLRRPRGVAPECNLKTLNLKCLCPRVEFLNLMEKFSLHSNTDSVRNSPTQLLAGKPADSLSLGSSSRSLSPQLLYPSDIIANHHGKPLTATSLQATPNDSVFQIITVSKGTGLGLNVVGGINRNEGPLVHILEVIPGGDCHKDGRLRAGDQLVSINKESLIGITYEEARSLINRTKLRSSSSWEITFIRREPLSSQAETVPPPSSLLTSDGYGLQLPPSSSPNESIDSKMSILNVTRAGFTRRKQSPAFSANNSTVDASAGAVGPTWSDDYGPQRRKISLNPTVRLQADKLEMALNYLGIQPTKEQQEILRQQLPKDPKGTVSFGDFVQVARNLFCLQLDGAGGAQGQAALNAHEIAQLLDSQFVSCDPLQREELEELKKERSEALQEICKLKEELAESERRRKQLAKELQTAKQEAKASVEEARGLRSRIHLAEAAQKQASGMELDYEEVIHLLEVEIADLRAQLSDHCGQNKDSIQDLRKRITVLDCQLRKSETAKKMFEVATEKLLQFVEVLPEVLLDTSTSLTNLSDSKATFSSKTLIARLGRNGRTLPASLAAEAKELTKSVRAILEAESM